MKKFLAYSRYYIRNIGCNYLILLPIYAFLLAQKHLCMSAVDFYWEIKDAIRTQKKLNKREIKSINTITKE